VGYRASLGWMVSSTKVDGCSPGCASCAGAWHSAPIEGHKSAVGPVAPSEHHIHHGCSAA
jgi:hypothetical protein